MDADFSVELGPPSEDATLEMPWQSGSADGPRYFDLKRQPELLQFVPEATQFPEMAQFLQRVNSTASALETAKCDVWLTDELSEAEEVFEAECKVGSYVDLLFGENESEARYSFFRHEDLARSLARLLQNSPEIAASAEFIVRRCYYHQPGKEDTRSGFYLTFYLFGYGNDEDEARDTWAKALQLAATAILQLAAGKNVPLQ
jgi:hypothetical protein